MPLSWNEIRDRAIRFSLEWREESSEHAEAKTFWDGFFNIFGLTRRRLASFEEPVKLRADGGRTSTGFIDLLWKGKLLVEHKSRGKDLDRAFAQAIDYFPGLPERDLPRYILVSDFARLRLYDLEEDRQWEFSLSDLHLHIRLFGFIAGYEARPIRPQDPVNLEAAQLMGKIHDQLKEAGYEGHELEVLLVRLLFCLFADDTGIFQPAQAFRDWVESDTAEDGHDLGAKISQLFEVLNTLESRRQRTLDESLAAFPFVNGKLFEERLPIPSFDRRVRENLLDACGLDWGRISPAIFGALFQSIKNRKERRNLGEHYTSEANILKLIEPLFLEELRAELAAAKGNENRLLDFKKKLRRLSFLDPACGCGNFLVVAYRELRLLELEILRAAAKTRSKYLDIFAALQVNVDQFYGIEIEEFPAQIAQVALWLTDHQMNLLVSQEFGLYYARLPLLVSPRIEHGNALRIEWETLVPKEQLSYILGNPPFVGKKEQTPAQKDDFAAVMRGVDGFGVLDYVTAWYVKAARFVRGTGIRCAFVSTNSISQGEQPGVLWPVLWGSGIRIHFAHRTFRWSNEARGRAAVHCVIVGFGEGAQPNPTLFDYPHVDGPPHAIQARNINPYLVDAPDVVLDKRTQPIYSLAPEMRYGSMPIDDGHLTLSTEERDNALSQEPNLKPWIRPYAGGEEYINGTERWCLWLVDAPPALLRASKTVRERVARVKAYRSSRDRKRTLELAATPALFGEIRQPAGKYLLVPKVSSENRPYMPIGFLEPQVIASGSSLIVPEAGPYHFGILTSVMHMAWMRAVCGRLESRYQYSARIVYNNFPWPQAPPARAQTAIEAAAQAVLTTRADFAANTLADLYDPLTMPPSLVKAHQRLDRAVDAAYGYKGQKTDAERVAFLFGLYQKYTTLFPVAHVKKRLRRPA